MNEDLFRRIKTRLKLGFYLMNDEWLRDCIEFYVNQHRNPNDNEILEFVKVQWQLSDLREINNENGSLPRNLSQQKLVTLSENYILQVEQMYDITTSKYKQLEQIRNTHCSEVELTETEMLEKWEPPKKRMMQLRLTDGLQDIIGIEYTQITRLNDMLLPGYKVMIMGPIICRRGVLLLKEGQLKGIGGEVDSLLIPNALENVLARALNLQENPDPYNDNEAKSNNVKENKKLELEDSFFEEDFQINLDELSRIEDSHNKNDIQSNNDTNKTEIETEINTEIKTESFSKITIEKTVTKKEQSCKEDIALDDDDCFFEMVDEEQLIDSQGNQKNNIAPFRTFPMEEEDDIIILNDEEIIENVQCHKKVVKKEKLPASTVDSHVSWFTNKTAVPSTSTAQPEIRKKSQENITSLTAGKRAFPMSPPETVALKKGKIDRKITEFTKRPNSPDPPKICDFIHDVNKEVLIGVTNRKIRARVEILGKLAKKDLRWILEATVTDGTGKIEVSFSNEVLENLLGFTVQEFSLKKKLKKNPEIERELRMSFRNAEQKIKTLDAVLELELDVGKKPKVIKITELTQEQKETVEKRLKHFLNTNNF
ncbi:uncharacterized protein LOC143178808 [Calliopsis andreniformis]|uniref:uncharacterized protein LOC143178808 n=1 Tax=Calliopsis andreniformis TaxID=337506 RepID=UPI003FCD3C6E